jgi:hypothetical protein
VLVRRCSRLAAAKEQSVRWKRKELSQVLPYTMGWIVRKGSEWLKKTDPLMMLSDK